MTEIQAYLIRLRFYNTNKHGEFCELAKCFPKFAKALMMLPDESGLRLCNMMLRDMVKDTVKMLGLVGVSNDMAKRKKSLVSLAVKLSSLKDDEYTEQAVLGFLVSRKYAKNLPDKVSGKELVQFLEWTQKLLLDVGLLANVLRGHLCCRFEEDGEPLFSLTPIGKRYTEEHILTKNIRKRT